MKATIERATLLRCLSHVQSVVERRNTIPILSNVLIEADAGGMLRVMATDLDLQVVESLSAVSVESPGSITVSAHLLFDIARKLPDGSQVSLETGDNRMAVKAGRSRFSLPTLPRDDFPVIVEGDLPTSFEVPAKVLAELIDRTRFAISTEETRYYLNGIFLHVSDEDSPVLKAAATDGHRLARFTIAQPEGAAGMPDVIVPRKAVAELRKLLDEAPEGNVLVDLSPSKIRFTLGGEGGVVLTSKLIDGTFPDYSRVIPTGNDKLLKLDPRSFFEGVDRVATIAARVSEVLGAMKIVQGFNQETRESQRFAEAVEDTFATAKRRIRLRSLMNAMFITFVFGSITALMWRGALQVAAGEITGGTIAFFVIVGVMVAGAFAALSEVYSDLLRAAGAATRLSELLAEEPSIAPPARPVELPLPPRGGLSFQNVVFRYPTRPEVAALRNFSLLVEPGETVAIVGPSGAGKSTIFQLAERFYDPQAGMVRIDGVPLTSADPVAIRKRMAYVPQEGILFAASARDNLRYGHWQANDEDIWEAARAANAEEFLRSLPQGLDTHLGEGGARLSGGQRQRVAIARALLRDAPILLLDEATSALDAESERLVQDALEHLMKDRTTLVIAHRLATVRAADRIVVMDKGEIVEQGSHGELIAAGGLYARLAALQFTDSEHFAAAQS